MAWPTTSRQERGYGADHDRMRALLLREVLFCEECARNGLVRLGRIADHKKPKAQGGTNDRANYQLLCDPCSEAKTIAEKGATAKPEGGIDRSGRPTSATHPWNRRT